MTLAARFIIPFALALLGWSASCDGQTSSVRVKGPTNFADASLSPEHLAAAKELQGEWTITSFGTNGERRPADPDRIKSVFGSLVTDWFDGNKLITLTPIRTKVEIEYRLDPTKEPKWIDQRFTGGRIGPWIAKGIYKLDNDVLTICYGDPNVDRPTDFSTKPGDGRKLNEYKRIK
jgi:uncharacterized protein (TIGR03067 family)